MYMSSPSPPTPFPTSHAYQGAPTTPNMSINTYLKPTTSPLTPFCTLLIAK